MGVQGTESANVVFSQMLRFSERDFRACRRSTVEGLCPKGWRSNPSKAALPFFVASHTRTPASLVERERIGSERVSIRR